MPTDSSASGENGRAKRRRTDGGAEAFPLRARERLNLIHHPHEQGQVLEAYHKQEGRSRSSPGSPGPPGASPPRLANSLLTFPSFPNRSPAQPRITKSRQISVKKSAGFPSYRCSVGASFTILCRLIVDIIVCLQ